MFILIGALTSKTYSFMGRAQEIEHIESIDYLNIFGNAIFIEVSNLIIIRILPRLTIFKYSEQITDLIRFSYDSLLIQRILNVYEYISNFYKKSMYINIFIYIKNLQKFNYYYLINNKLKLNLILNIILTEDCDYTFLKKLTNLSNFNIILNYKLFITFKNIPINYFLFFKDLDLILNVNIIQLIGLNLRMEYPLLLIIILQKIKQYNLKIYNIYSFQSSVFFYKSYSFTLKEFYNQLNFREKAFNNIYIKNNIKNDLKNHFLYLLNYKVINLYNFKNILNLFLHYLVIIKIYFKINFKILLENLYQYNYILLNINLLNNLFIFNINKKFNYIYDFLYFISYNIILLTLNLTLYIKNILYDLLIYIGHHFLFSLKNKFKFILPITFFFEMDTLQYNIFGNLITGKFIYSPMLKVYEIYDLIYFLFSKNLKLTNKLNININFFLNKIKYFKLNFNLKLFLQNFKNFLTNQSNFELIFFNLYYKFSLIKIFLNSDLLVNLELIKNSNLLQSKNLSFFKFNNYINYLYFF